jgi:hypothetical protein
MKLIFKIISCLILFCFLIPLAVSAAGTYNATAVDKKGKPIPGDSGTACYEGIVPCGKCVSLGGSLDEKTKKCAGGENKFIPCSICHAFIIIHDVVNFFIFSIVLPVAVLMIVIGGILFLLGGTNPGYVSWANSILYNTFLGLFIIFGAFIIVGTFLSLIGVAQWTGLGTNQWFKINCDIKFIGTGIPCY